MADDLDIFRAPKIGRVVRGEAKPIVSIRDGLQNLRITEAIAGIMVPPAESES